MNYSIYRFTLDIHKTKSQVSIPVLFHDTGIKFYISLTDGGKPYFIEDGCRAVFSAKKSDGTQLFNDCIIEDNTRVRYDFTEQTTNCEGMMNCEIRLYGKDGKLITTPAFVVVVDARVIYDNDVLDSESESTTLDNIVANEESRLAGERMRIEAENARAAAEAERVLAEEDRREDELERRSAENERVIVEQARVKAEAAREASETYRKEAFASMEGTWVAYSLYADGTDYTWTWSEGQRYIGICNGKTPPQDKTGFVWSKFVDTGVYVGGGEMPEWCDLQIDPDGEVTEIVQTCGQSKDNVMSQKSVSDTFANALRGSKSGTAVVLDDTSPIEHEMGVTVRGKNIFDIANAPHATNMNASSTAKAIFTNTGCAIDCLAAATNSSASMLYQVCPIDMVRGKTVAISFNRYSTITDSNSSTVLMVKVGDSFDQYASVTNSKTVVEAKKTIITNGVGKQTFTIPSDTAQKYLYILLYAGIPASWVVGDVVEYSDIQVEINDTATSYAPYIEDVSTVKVKKYGKNLWNLPTFTQKSNQYISVDIPAGATYTCSARVIENTSKEGSTSEGGRIGWVYTLNGETVNNPRGAWVAEGGVSTNTVTIPNGATDIRILFQMSGSAAQISWDNLQIEVGGAQTSFAPYVEVTECAVAADGTAEGVTSLYPCTTLITDTDGVVIFAEYNRDANKAINDIFTRIAALEAAVLN